MISIIRLVNKNKIIHGKNSEIQVSGEAHSRQNGENQNKGRIAQSYK